MKGAVDPISMNRAYLTASPAIQRQILGFVSPVDGPKATELRVAQLAKGGLDRSQVEECVKVTSVFNHNGVEVGPADEGGKRTHLGFGLYMTACRASHSCQPNCTWLADLQGRRVVRTLTDVAEGEELCIDYLSEEGDLLPVHQRRAKLRNWEFTCGCPRCAAHGDDTRRFPCMEATCKGHKLAHQPTAEDQAELTACSVCGTHASPSYTSRMLRQEADLIQKMAEIPRLGGSGGASVEDVRPLVMRLRPPHPHHRLAALVAHLQEKVHQGAGEWEAAATAVQAVNVRVRVHLWVRVKVRGGGRCLPKRRRPTAAQCGACGSHAGPRTPSLTLPPPGWLEPFRSMPWGFAMRHGRLVVLTP